MKKLFSLVLLLVAVASASAQQNVIYFKVGDFLSGNGVPNLYNQKVSLTDITENPRTINGVFVSPIPRTTTTSKSGYAYFTNVVWGTYNFKIVNSPEVAFDIQVETNTTGTVDGATLTSITNQPNPLSDFYTKGQVDAIVADIPVGGTTNVAGDVTGFTTNTFFSSAGLAKMTNIANSAGGGGGNVNTTTNIINGIAGVIGTNGAARGTTFKFSSQGTNDIQTIAQPLVNSASNVLAGATATLGTQSTNNVNTTSNILWTALAALGLNVTNDVNTTSNVLATATAAQGGSITNFVNTITSNTLAGATAAQGASITNFVNNVTSNSLAGTISTKANTNALLPLANLFTNQYGFFSWDGVSTNITATTNGQYWLNLQSAALVGLLPISVLPSFVITNGWTSELTLNQGTPAGTNSAMSKSNVVQYIADNFVGLGTWVTGNPATSIMSVTTTSTTTNAAGVGLLDNISIVGGNLHSSATGGGGTSPATSSNILVQITNEIVWDLSKIQHLTLQLNTNLHRLTFSNAFGVTNWSSGLVQLDTWEDTNGTWRILSTNVPGGLLRTYGGGWIRGTNFNQYDSFGLRLDGTLTNLLGKWDTNAQPVTLFTNTLTAGGGGGGGGGFTLLTSMSQQNDNVNAGTITTTNTLNIQAGTKLAVAAIVQQESETDGYNQSLSDLAGNTWTKLTQYNNSSGARNCVTIYYCLNPTPNSADTFTIGGRYPGIAAATFSGGTPAYDQQTGASFSNAGSFPAGSLTAGASPCLHVAAYANYGAYAVTAVDNGFTIVQNANNGAGGSSVCLAYLAQTTSTAINPTATMSPSNGDGGAAHATFK